MAKDHDERVQQYIDQMKDKTVDEIVRVDVSKERL